MQPDTRTGQDPGRTTPHLLAVAVVAGVVRLAYFLSYLYSECNGYLAADEIYYREWALRIRDGSWVGEGTFEQGPLYAYWLALQFLAGFPEPLILFLQSLTGVGVCVLVYLCGRELFDERIATTAGVLTALYGPLVFYESLLMKSFLSPLLVTLTLYFGLRYARTMQKRWACLAGATVGLACLVRESYALLMFPLVVWTWVQLAARGGSLRARVGHLLAVTASFGLVLLPAVVRNSALTGELVLVTTGGGEVMYIAHGPGADGYWNFRAVPAAKMYPGLEHQAYRDEAERRTGRELTAAQASRFWYGEALREVRAHPGQFLLLTGTRALILLNNHEVPDECDYQAWREFVPVLYPLPTFGWIVAFGLLGLCVCAPDWRRCGLAVGLVAMIVLSVLLTYNFGRFRIGMMPLWALFATAGLFRWLAWWRGPAPRHRLLAAAAGAACLGVTVFSFLPPPRPPGFDAARDRQYWRNQILDRYKLRQTAAELATVSQQTAEVHAQLGRQLIKAGYIHEGFHHYHTSLSLAPANPQLRVTFSQDLLAAGYESESIDLVEEAMRIDAAFGGAAANNLLVYVLRERPDLMYKFRRRLVELAQRMCQGAGQNNPGLLYTLAAVYVSTDRIRQAADTAERALALARKAGDEPLATALLHLLERCRSAAGFTR